ncbi:MAG: alpha/beta hydrolase [Rhizobiaceae bacterium]
MKLFLGAVAVYAGVVALMYLLQTHLLFPARLAGDGTSRLPDAATYLEVNAPDNVRLVGMRIKPVNNADVNKPILIGFGGNAWQAQNTAEFLHGLYPENEVIAFHYRGYGESAGKPSAERLLSDSLLIYDHVQETVGPRKTVGIGFSIGSAVAAHLASKRSLAGLILVSPFDSLEALASQHYPWLPVKWFLRHRTETIEDIQRVTAPTAVIAAELDRIIPPPRTQIVRGVIPNLVLDVTIAGAGHNDLYGRVEFRKAMEGAMNEIQAVSDQQ